MTSLELVKGAGWILTTPYYYDVCENCLHPLKLPFYFCKQKKKAFCIKCELERAKVKRLCGSLETEHEHLHIIDVKNSHSEVNREEANQ